MQIEINRVIATKDAAGKSVFVDLGEPYSEPVGGLGIVNVWGTELGVPTVTSGEVPQPVIHPFFPGPGASRLVVGFFPPDSASVDESTPAKDPEVVQPGLIGAYEPDNPGFHTTDSVDYGICLSGEIHLELDDGEMRKITPGTIVVQLGGRHAWRNLSDNVATMIFVLHGANRR